MKTALRAAFLLLGLALLALFLSQTHWRDTLAHLSKLGPAAPLFLLPYFLVYLVDARAWQLSFAPKLNVPFLTLWQIRWAGESVNNVVPSAYVGGEAVKVLLLKRNDVPPTQATAAAIVSKSAQTLAQLLFICAAAAAFLPIAPNLPGLHTGIWTVLLGGAIAVFLLFWIQRRGIVASTQSLARRLPFVSRQLAPHLPAWLDVDAAITRFYSNHRPQFLLCVTTYLAGWTLDTLEIYGVAWLLNQPMTWTQALVVEAFVGVAKVLGMWIPGSLGVQEGGILLLGRAVGLPDPFCLAYAVLRRVRELVFIILGWLLLLLHGIRPTHLHPTSPR